MEEFKILVGAQFDPSQFGNLQKQLKELEKEPIKIKLDLSESGKEITKLKESIESLTGKNNGNKGNPINVSGKEVSNITSAMSKLAETIDKIKSAMGTLDKDKGMKSLLTSVNEINSALNKTSAEIKTLSNAFSKGFNFELKIGGQDAASKSQALKKAAEDSVSVLKKQAKALEEAFGGQNQMFSMAGGTKHFLDLIESADKAKDSTLTSANRMNALKEYITVMKELASTKGVDISNITSKFGGEADKLVEDVNKIASGEKYLEDATSKLKSIFGSGLDSEALTSQLQNIIEKLTELANVVSSVSKMLESGSLKINGIGGTGTSGTGEEVTKQITETTQAYQRMKEIIKEMSSIRLEFGKKDVIENSKEIDTLIDRYNKLETEYNELQKTFSSDFTEQQSKSLARELENAMYKKTLSGAKATDSLANQNRIETERAALQAEAAEVKRVEEAYGQVISKIKEMGQLQTKIGGLDSVKNASQIQELSKEFEIVEQEYNQLRSTFDQQFNNSQIEGIAKAWQDVEKSISMADAKLSDKSAVAQKSEETKQIAEAYNQVISKIKEMGQIKKTLAGLDSNKDAKQIEELTRRLETLNKEYNVLRQSFDSQFNASQFTGIINATAEAERQVMLVNAKMADKSANKASIEAEKAALQAQAEEAKRVQDAYKQVFDIVNQMNKLEIKIGGLKAAGGNEQQIDVWINKLNELRSEYMNIMSQMQGDFSFNQLLSIGQSLNSVTTELDAISAKVEDAKQKLAQEVQIKFDNGTLSNETSKLEADFNKLKEASTESTTAMQQFRTASSELQTALQSGNIDDIVSSYQRYQEALKTADNQIKINIRSEKEAAEAVKQVEREQATLTRSNTLSNEIQTWMNNNKKAAQEYGAELKRLQTQLSGNIDAGKLKEVSLRFKEIKSEASAAGFTISGFGKSLKDMAFMTLGISGSYMAVQKGVQTIRQMFDEILKVDTAMTELYRITDLSKAKYSELYSSMAASAKEYGATLDDMINSTADWVRLGFKPDESNRLAEITSMYQHVTDLDNDTAVENLVTAYKGFEKSLLESTGGDKAQSIEYIADIYDKLGNEFAVSAANVGDGVKRSASALQLAGNSIQESAAMVTGMTEVTQMPEKAGSALKILSLRLRGMKGDLEELGEEVDPNVESISKMQTQILNLTHGKINIFEDDGSFKSTYQIMKEISDIYDHLTDTERADLLETIAGKNRANDVAALISNWSQVEKALDAANNAQGTAAEEQEKYMNSLQGHLDQLTASWQVLANTLINSDFLKGLISGATGFLDVINKIIDSIGTIPALAGVVSAALSFKNIGVFKTMNNEVTLFGQSLSKIADDFGKLGLKGGFKNLFAGDKRGVFDTEYTQTLNNDVGLLTNHRRDMSRFGGNLSKDESIEKNLKGASTAALEYAKNTDKATFSIEDFKKQQALTQIGVVAQSKGLSNASKIIGEYNKGFQNTSYNQEAFLKTVTQSNQPLGNFLSGLNGAKASMSGYIGSLISAKAATLAMQAAQMALNMALSMGVAFAVSAAISAIMKLADSMDTSFAKATERAKESKRVFEESASDVDEVQKRLDDVKAKISESKSKSLTDSKDIANLETQKELLEAQLKIKQQIAKTNEEKANKDAETALTQERGYNIETLKDKNNIVDRSYFLSGSGGAVNSSLGYGNIIEETRKKQELLNEATKKYNELVIQHSKTKNSDKWKQEEKEIEQYSKYIENLSTEVNSNISDISEQVDTLVGKSGYEKVVKDAQSLYKDVEDGTQKIQTLSQITEGMGLDLSKILGGEGQENEAFEKRVDDYIKKINELNEAKNKIADGTLSDEDKKNLFYDFPELKGQTDNLDSAIGSLAKSMNSDIVKDFTAQMNNIHTEEGVASMQAIQDAVMGVGESMVDVEELTSGLKTAQEDFSALGTAINESNSATGLSVESMEKLETMYSGLKGYDSATLFERTANGIKLNADELSRLNKLYEDNQSQEFASSLDNLNSKLALEKEALKEAEEARNENAIQLHENNIEGIQNQITQVENLSSMWKSATSAYNEYVQAQAGGTHHDTLESFAKDRENIEKMMNAGWGNNEAVTKYWDAIFGEERTMSNKEALAQFNEELENTGHALSDYLVFDNGELQASGIKTLFEDISSGLGEDFAKMEDGTNILNLQGDNLQKIADYLGVDIGFVQMFADAMNDMPNFDIKFDGVETGADKVKDSVNQISMSVDEAKSKLQTLQAEGTIDDSIDLSVNVDTSSAEQIKQTLDQLGKVKIDTEVDPSGAAALESLKAELQHEYYLKVNVETGGKLEEAEGYIKRIKELAGKDPINVAVKGDNGEQIKNLADKLANMPEEVKIPLGIEMKDSKEDILSKIGKDKINVTGIIDWKKGEVEKPENETLEGKANYKIGEKPKNSDLDVLENKANYKMGSKPKNSDLDILTGKANYKLGSHPTSSDLPVLHQKVVVDKVGGVDGTAHAKGTAYKNGNWGTKKSGTALVGEEGFEILVRDGHWYTIGEDSAEFLGYKKDDIIFNHEQSKQILEKGKIIHGKKRGTTLANGTAYVDGTAFARGSSNKNKDKKNKKSDKKEDKALKKFQDWFAKLFDWIDIKLKRQTDKITNYTKKADAAQKSNNFGSANANYRRAINATASQIELEQKSAEKYQRAANKVLQKAYKTGIIKKGDIDKIRESVANGTLNIKSYGERAREVIKDYQAWADKAETARNSIADLHDKIREYVKDLKDVREEQRKFKNDRIDLFDKIGGGSFANDNGRNASFQNSQIRYQNRQIQNKNSSYVSMTEAVAKDYNRVSRTANNVIRLNTRNPAKYNKALETAQRAIKQKKKIPASVLNTIRKYSLSTYERLYAYNLALDNVEATRLERAADYAVNSAEWYKNVSTTYGNREKAINNTMSLNKNKAKVANGPIAANRFLNRAAAGYDNLLKNDRAEIRRFSSAQRHQAGKVMNRRGGRGYRFDGASSAVKKATNRIISSARKYVKTGKPIPPSLLSKIANYYSKGYISQNFYDACINYNNAVEYKEQAKAQYEIDKVTSVQEKTAIGKEKFSNMEQYYTNAQNRNKSKTDLITAKQKIKTTKGFDLSKKDYQLLKKQSRAEQSIYRHEYSALQKVINNNLKKGLWKKSSQEYKEAIQELADIKVKIADCTAQQEEWNNAIIQIPFDKIDRTLDVLNTADSRYDSALELKKAQGKDLSKSNYDKQINYNNRKIKEESKTATLAWKNYQKAVKNKGAYGGKTASEWLVMFHQAKEEVTKLKIENQNLKKELRDDVYWRTYERMHDALERTKNIISGISDLISSDMYFDKNGNLTIFGTSQIATYVKSFENARQEVVRYTKDIKHLQDIREMYPDKNEYLEKENELQTKLLESAANMKKYLESIKDMYKDLAKSELDALYKLIDARSEALQKKKDYYDYDKSLREKTRDVQELTSQLAALEGINTAEAKGKRAKLQQELSEKQEDLEDTVFNHGLDLSKDALSEMKDVLDKQFNEKWDKMFSDLSSMKELLNSANQLTQTSTASIVSGINQILKFYGINPISTGIKSAAKYASGTKSAPRKMNAITNENGSEIIVTKQGMLTPLSAGDGVVPHDLTQRLYDMAMGKIIPNTDFLKTKLPDYNLNYSGATNITQNYDALIRIEGSADAATVEDLKNMRKDLLQSSYEYTSKKLHKGYIRAGGKRVI